MSTTSDGTRGWRVAAGCRRFRTRAISSARPNSTTGPRERQHGGTPFGDSVLPVVEAQRAEIVRNDYEIGDHVRILPTPGHTPGHVAITFGKGKDNAVFSGDLMHSPLQARHPELSAKFDVDQAQAATTRRNFLERYCDTDTLCCTAHFPPHRVGRSGGWGTDFPARRSDRLASFAQSNRLGV